MNVKVLDDFRCILWGISRDEAVLIDVLQMDFGANKKPAEIIREGVFGGNYFRDIYSGVTGKWYQKSWKEFEQLKDID